ncbi:MAG: glycosyltransferase family 4 protein [Selenomonas ruminantium]|nr:glycosyltransferase family 4 protein [Selenomonas ruminantium]
MEIQVGIEEIKKNLASSVRVFGYGAGCYGQALSWLANEMSWSFSGFLVSDGEQHPDSINGYRVMQLSEAGDLSNVAVILSVNEKNKSEIVRVLPKSIFKIINLPNRFYDDLVYRQNVLDGSFILAERKLKSWYYGDLPKCARVLFFTHGSELLGANRSLLQNLLYWQEMGIELFVISPSLGDLNAALSTHGIPSMTAPYSWWVGEINSVHIYDNTVVEDKLINMLVKCNFDLVYSNSSVIDIGAHIAERLNLPHIWHIREFVEEDFNWRFLLGRKESLKYILDKSFAAICISKALMRKCEEVVGRKDEFFLIPNGVRLESLGNDNCNKFCQDVLRIGMCGAVQESKNQKDLIVALSLLTKDVLQHFEVEFYGPQNPDYQEVLDKYIDSNGLSDRVRFYGYTQDVVSHLRTCHIGVMASRMEAFGRVTVEYMLAGLLTIASNTGANPELLRNGKDGLLYEYGDPMSLAQCLTWCVNNRQKMYEMANQAQINARLRFDPQRTATSIYNIMKKAIKENT